MNAALKSLIETTALRAGSLAYSLAYREWHVRHHRCKDLEKLHDRAHKDARRAADLMEWAVRTDLTSVVTLGAYVWLVGVEGGRQTDCKNTETMKEVLKLAEEAEAQAETKAEREAKVLALAREQHEDEGRIELDDDAVVSEGGDNGAYVQGWVWASFEGTDLDKETHCPQCGAPNDNGEGYDGLCGNCADKAEKKAAAK